MPKPKTKTVPVDLAEGQVYIVLHVLEWRALLGYLEEFEFEENASIDFDTFSKIILRIKQNVSPRPTKSRPRTPRPEVAVDG